MARISLWTGEGCLFSGVTMLIDALSIAELWHRTITKHKKEGLFETEILTSDGHPVEAYGGITINPDRSINDLNKTDCLVISPFLPNINPIPDSLDSLFHLITKLRKEGTTIAAVCTGSFILAEMGLLDGKRATTNCHFAGMFKKRYPLVRLNPECMMTEDDGIICTGAVTAVYNLGLHLIRQFGSPELASICSKALLVDPNRNSQAPYAMSIPKRHHGDPQVLKAQFIIETNYAAIDSIDSVASEVGISARHFKRRFKQATGDLPLKYLQRARIDAAKKELETTKNTVDEITWSVGYKDVSSFSRLFKQHTKLSPKAYRDKFFNPLSQ